MKSNTFINNEFLDAKNASKVGIVDIRDTCGKCNSFVDGNTSINYDGVCREWGADITIHDTCYKFSKEGEIK